MKTTIDIPHELLEKAKVAAMLQGVSLRELICDALASRLASVALPRPDRPDWRNVFGQADPKAVAKVDQVIDADLERVIPSEWR